MMLRIPGTLCPYRNVHNVPAVIFARLGSCIIQQVYKYNSVAGAYPTFLTWYTFYV
jgi:hypothetical protein